MSGQTMNVAEAKKHFSEILGRVAYGGEQIIITKRGRPLAKLVPVEEEDKHLADAEGRLDDDDEFFTVLDQIMRGRGAHLPRVEKTMKQNIALSLDKELIRKIRVLAAQRQISISGLLAQELRAMVEDEERYEWARKKALANLKQGFHLGGEITATREELHER
ncbi:type II toxin-antitoxin system prevent-host-death family antitoxin [Desulfoferrobacter suflitae]|uniref:type II toxin-antitoxin system prevent-host-death family antitoxin n=1 Tax=Desulfoferrobacter suflitae TaxID=2865782 RepID=UPI0021644CB0|nr:type II toxin-antitoxin system prevent-host-death family antitoxin [Desulfoferrobacter suflitae]MCK8603910.1 type II toxin-antitoxin system prevent-host-death family antitoxin [Desulfoferrobacter suflitae]